MTKAEYRVTIDAPQKAREQFLAALKDLESEASRSADVDVNVHRVADDVAEQEAQFQ